MSTRKTLLMWMFVVAHPVRTVRHLRAIRGRSSVPALGFLEGILAPR